MAKKPLPLRADQLLLDYEDKTQQARRLLQFSRAIFFALTVATVQYAWLGLQGMANLIAAGAFAMLASGLLTRRGHLGLAVLTLITSSTLVVFAIMWTGNGLQDSILLAIPVLLLVSGQLLKPRVFFVLLAFVICGVIVVGVGTLADLRGSVLVDTDFNRMTDSVLIVLVTGAMVWFLAHDVQFTLRNLRQEVLRHRESEKNLTYLAQHDALTRLPNRLLGAELLEQAMAETRRHGDMVALLFVDLDNFKDINDSLGHAAGDEFLQLMATRLTSAVRQCDIVCRQGGDEFLIGLTRVSDMKGISSSADEVLKQVAKPFMLRDTEVLPTCSIGIAVFDKHGQTFAELLRHADLAMYQAKEAGRNAFRFFDDSIDATVRETLHLISNLRLAIARGEFVLHYQPVVHTATGRLVGAEALVRWQSPTLGLVPPVQFIPAAERSGLIVDIGQWVLEQACRQMRQWHDDGAPHLVLAVNLSPVQFRRGNIEQIIERALAASGLPGHCLELEVTESTLVQDSDTFIQSLRRIKALGAHIAIDDFGTGYSSLSYLQRFEVDRLKIDQSFVRQLNAGPHSLALVTAIAHMARGLGLAITAEGVEDTATQAQLVALGCEQAQGYLFARPLTADAFGEFIAGQSGEFEVSQTDGIIRS